MRNVFPYDTFPFTATPGANAAGFPLAPAPSSGGWVIAVLAVAAHASGAVSLTFTSGSSGSTGAAISPAWPLSGTVPFGMAFNPSVWFATTTSGHTLTCNSSGAVASYIQGTAAFVPVGAP